MSKMKLVVISCAAAVVLAASAYLPPVEERCAGRLPRDAGEIVIVRIHISTMRKTSIFKIPLAVGGGMGYTFTRSP